MTDLEQLLSQESRRLKIPVWWVGGPVRDALMGRRWDDGDVACPHALKVAKAVARKLKAKLITLDDQYRIYRVIHSDQTLDFAQLQGKTIEQDLARRDFSINAMARAVGTAAILDPFGGQKDLKKKRVRALSLIVLRDDPIRRLRAFRFSAQLQFAIDPQTLGWIRSGSLNGIAAERIREEFLKFLSASGSAARIADLDQAGLLREILPEMEACRRTARSFYGAGGVLKHSVNTVKNLEWVIENLAGEQGRGGVGVQQRGQSPVRDYLLEKIGGHPRLAWLKLGGLLHDIGKPATAQKIGGRLRFFGHEEVGADMITPLASRLRLSRQETQILRLWVKHHMRLGSLASAKHITPKAVFRYFRDLEPEAIGMILVSLADHYDYLARSKWGKNTDPVEKMANRLLQEHQGQAALARQPKLLDGHAIMKALKLKPSPVIGQLLQLIQDEQIDGKLVNKAAALQRLPALYRKIR